MQYRIRPLLVLIIFLLFAVLQLNDPDPLLWISIYVVVSLFALLVMVAPKLNLKLAITVYQFLLLFYSVTYVPSFIEYLSQPDKIELVGQMKAESPWIEGTRELLGLLIAIFALSVLKKFLSITSTGENELS